MIRKNNDSIYNMYEDECNKNKILYKERRELKLEISNLKYELKYHKDSMQNKIKKEIEKGTTPLMIERANLQNELTKAHQEIDRLKEQIESKSNKEDQEYTIDKLESLVNKNSSNSGIPTSKEIGNKKTGANTYNHREKSKKQTGGQVGHNGCTLKKKTIESLIEKKNLEVKEIKHYVKGNKKQAIKYKIGLLITPYVEKHIFEYRKDYKEKMPKEFYSDVTYQNDIKTVITIFGNYCSMSYSKIKEIMKDITGGILNISEGTIDNIYEEFSKKAEPTVDNITNNILNGKYQHTDETTTSENGKETYYRGYANGHNVVYKYHQRKGDKPIEEDNILNRYIGTIISDHDTGIFKYGKNHQDCVIHIGRYCKEGYQNIMETKWQKEFYYYLIRLERGRKIISKFGQEYYIEEDIKEMEEEYDKILDRAKEENDGIESSYWKEKEETLYRRLKKYKKAILYYIYDFTVPYDNNYMERLLRMIKGKTKMSGGFRSRKGGIRFGNSMSIIKTAKLREVDVFETIEQVFENKVLFS